MPRTRECDFCGADIEPGTGTMLVLNDGTTHHFCSSKCEKNTGIGREARNLEWTDAGRRQSGRRQPEPEPVEETQEIKEADGVDAEAEDADTEEEDLETDAASSDDETEEGDEE